MKCECDGTCSGDDLGDCSCVVSRNKMLDEMVKMTRELELANQKIKNLEAALDMKNIMEKK